jgi:hypothetical protein
MIRPGDLVKPVDAPPFIVVLIGHGGVLIGEDGERAMPEDVERVECDDDPVCGNCGSPVSVLYGALGDGRYACSKECAQALLSQ